MDTDIALIQWLEEQVRQGTQDVSAYIYLAQFLIQSGQFRRARELLSKASSLDASHAQLHDVLAVALLQLGLGVLAELASRKAVALAPDNPGFMRRLGHILCIESRYEEAHGILARSYEIEPTDEKKEELATISRMIEEAKAGLGWSRKALMLAPTYSSAFVTLASNYTRTGECATALEALKCAFELNPNDTTLYQLGRAHVVLREYAEAVDCFRRLCKSDPTNPDAFRYLGQLLELQGDDEGAKTAYLRARQLDGRG